MTTLHLVSLWNPSYAADALDAHSVGQLARVISHDRDRMV